MTFGPRCADLVDNRDGLTPAGQLHALFELCWEHEMEEFPEQATFVGWRGHDHRWADRSLEAVDRRKREVDDVLAVLREIDRDALGPDDRLSYDLFRHQHELRRDGNRFPGEVLAVGRMTGPQLAVPRTIAMMPRATLGDYENLVARLHGLSVYVDQTITLLSEGVAIGVTEPRVVLDGVVDQVAALADAGPDESPLLAPFASFPAEVDDDDRAALRAEAAEAFTTVVAPAFRRLRDHLADRYVPAARESVARSDLPDGEAWYAHDLRRFTTTSLTAKEIHDLGRSEVERIGSAMAEVMAATGFTGTFEEFREHLRTDPRFFFDSPEALLAAYRDIAKRVDPALVRLFGTLPRLPYGVIPVPDHEAPSATTAYYMPGSPQAARPGWFYANTWDLRSRPSWEMEALTLHEAVPGHHLQIALAAELDDLPRFRTTGLRYTAFVEGWGLYAESLGEELGLYTDPYARFGRLTYEMWRAIRLVVDTGLHAFGWTRHDAIAYFRDHTGKADHDIAVEVDRYISWPGQAVAYKIGELALQRLRGTAAAALGEAFDVRAFHDTVLGAGAVPLDVREERVRDWIAATG